MELRKIRSLMAMVAESAIQDLELSTPDGTVRIVRGPAPAAAPQAAAPALVVAQAAPAAAAAQPAPATASALAAAPGEEGPRMLRSPLVGFGLRGRGTSAQPLVRVGDTVQAGQPVCVIRAMKLDTEIKAEAPGVLSEVLWEDGEPVQYGQPLFAFRPASLAARAGA